MNEAGCPVMIVGRAPHSNADGAQRTEKYKGDRSTTAPNEATKGRMNKIEVPGQPKWRQQENHWTNECSKLENMEV
jgi:hypothetical protein